MKLVVVGGPMRGKSYPINKLPLIIGRGRSADACLPLDTKISRFHCQLVRGASGIAVEDLGSGNGTFVAGKQLDEVTALGVRQLVRIGKTWFCLAEDHALFASLPRPDEESGARRAPRLLDHAAPAEGVSVITSDAAGTDVEITGRVPVDDERSESTSQHDGAATNRLRKRLRAFQDVAAALSGKLDTKELLQAAVSILFKVIPADRAIVIQPDDDDTFRPIVFEQRGRTRDTEITVSRTLLERVLKERASLLVRDTHQDQRLAEARSVMALKVRSAMAVPLLEGKRVLGVIFLDTKSAQAFTEEDLDLVDGVAQQVSLALANARLYEELKEAYHELEAAQERAVRAEKLTIIGTLSASTAHDIGNMMLPIKTISQLAMKDRTLDPELKEAFSRNMERLDALTKQLLSFSRQKETKLEPLNINSALDQAFHLVTTQARHASVEIKRDFTPGLPSAMADKNRLDQVVVNLILNAVHAMKGHGPGTVTVVTRECPMGIEIEFRDTGPGIPPEILERIFEPFFTTKGDEGTGLGLPSCVRIVEEEHGGELAVTSTPGHGTSFFVRLPAVK